MIFDADVLHLCLAAHLVGFEQLRDALHALQRSLHARATEFNLSTASATQEASAPLAFQQPHPGLTLYWESPLLLPAGSRRPSFLVPADNVHVIGLADDSALLLVNVTFHFAVSANHAPDLAAAGGGGGGGGGSTASGPTVSARMGCLSANGIYTAMARSWSASDWQEHWHDALSVDLDQTSPNCLAKFLAQALRGVSQPAWQQQPQQPHSRGTSSITTGTRIERDGYAQFFLRLYYPELQQAARLYLGSNNDAAASSSVRQQRLDPHVLDMEFLSRGWSRLSSEATAPQHAVATTHAPFVSPLATDEQVQQIQDLWLDCRNRWSRAMEQQSNSLTDQPSRGLGGGDPDNKGALPGSHRSHDPQGSSDCPANARTAPLVGATSEAAARRVRRPRRVMAVVRPFQPSGRKKPKFAG